MSASKNLGKVFMTPKGIWDKNSNYTKLDIVTNKVGKISCGYIATTDIEKNIEITDNRWLKLFELLDGDLTEEYKAVQTDVANKATDVDANKKAVDLIYSQMQKLYDVEISTTTPTNERTGLWINTDDISGVINIPEIKDDEVSDVDTWSSKKIDNVTGSLKEDISTKITKFYASSKGETHLADSDNGKIMDMMLYGKSEQKQYSGDNIYYMDYEDYSQTYNGARITSTKFGYSVSGAISGAGGYTLTNRYITLAPGTYKMLLKNISALKIGLSKRDYSAIATISEGKTDTTFTLDEETEVCLTIRYSNTTSNETNEIMLTKNLEATSYEPYTGGIPSPNPDYPQEIKSVVNPTVKISNEDGTKSQTVALPYTLNAIPVSSGGNVTINGQQYIADYVDVERGKLVRCVKKLFLKQYQWSKAINKGVLRFYASTIDAVGIDGNKVIKNAFSISSHFTFVTSTPDRIGTFITNADGTNANIGFAFSTDTTTSSDDFNNWILNNKPFVFLPVLKEELPLTSEQTQALKELATYYPVTNISVNSEQLDGYTVFNYPISMENGWNYVKQQIGDTRDYIYDMDLQSAEAYVNSEYAVALTELEV